MTLRRPAQSTRPPSLRRSTPSSAQPMELPAYVHLTFEHNPRHFLCCCWHCVHIRLNGGCSLLLALTALEPLSSSGLILTTSPSCFASPRSQRRCPRGRSSAPRSSAPRASPPPSPRSTFPRSPSRAPALTRRCMMTRDRAAATMATMTRQTASRRKSHVAMPQLCIAFASSPQHHPPSFVILS